MNEKERHPSDGSLVPDQEAMADPKQSENKQEAQSEQPSRLSMERSDSQEFKYEPTLGAPIDMGIPSSSGGTISQSEGRPIERPRRARGTAAMDPQTRKEVARKGGLAVSRNKQHMAEIGRKGGQSVSKNREHMAQIGRKGGAASRGHR